MDVTDTHQHDAYGSCDNADEAHQYNIQMTGAAGEGRRRIEVITGLERRRKWSRAQKARIINESFQPGANVAAVARRHGVAGGLLHYWRRCAREDASRGEALEFVPVVAEAPEKPAPVADRAMSSIEIDLDGVRIRVNGSVDADALRTVLAAVRSGG
jgi:transposase